MHLPVAHGTPFLGKNCYQRTVRQCAQNNGYGMECKFLHCGEVDNQTERIRAEAQLSLSQLRKRRRIERNLPAPQAASTASTASASTRTAAEPTDQQVYEVLWKRHELHKKIQKLQKEIDVLDVEISHR